MKIFMKIQSINKDNNVQIINVNNIKSNYNSIENSDKNKSKTISNSKQTGNNCAKTIIMSKNKDNNEIKKININVSMKFN